LVFFCVSKRLHLSALVCIYISQNGPVLTEICSPPGTCHLKTYQCSRTWWPISAFFRASKGLHFGALVRVYISQNGPVLTEICSLPGTCHLKTYQCSRMWWPISGFFHASKGLHFGALVCIYISQNGPVLTEICSPPPGTCHLKPTNAQVSSGRFWRSFMRQTSCIRVY